MQHFICSNVPFV